ncbi:PAS domain S-box protein [Puia sp. P3]|uniref:sensor histidine kinase n=1 Tax=Puia sp. P3 TaxID=3423952 RepID=UPI003D67B820
MTPNLRVPQPELAVSNFFEKTPDLVCIAHRNGYFKKVNQAVIDKLGYSEPELMSVPISNFIHPEDRHFTATRRSELLRGKNLLNFQNRYVTKAGATVWLEWTSIYFPEDEVVFAIAKDITGRKEEELEVVEKYKKFKGLATHFKSSIEEDRKTLANELQEELAHLAEVLKTDIEWIKSNAYELSPVARTKIEHASTVGQRLIKAIRRISFAISPNMLGHLGLGATLAWYCREFSLMNGLSCFYEGSFDESALSNEVKTDLFRICQECLSNTLSHGQASGARVVIEESDDRVRMVISDDGKGFDAELQKRKPGLVRMRERAASINGELTIHSGIGNGTRICVSVGKNIL